MLYNSPKINLFFNKFIFWCIVSKLYNSLQFYAANLYVDVG